MMLQEQVEEMKKKEERLEKQMTEVTSENKKLSDPLQKANNEVDELRRQLANYEKDKQLLVVSNLQLTEASFSICRVHSINIAMKVLPGHCSVLLMLHYIDI